VGESAANPAFGYATIAVDMEQTSPAGVVIRRLSADDAERYRAFRLRALRETPSAFSSSFAEESARPLVATVERLAPAGRPNDAVFGAFAGDALVGVAGLRRWPGEQECHKATLFGMAVAPQRWGQGIGMALVQHVLDYARHVEGLVQVELRYSEGNAAAERLYRACGFEEWGREAGAVFVAGNAITKVHMTCVLTREPLRTA
jgi:RimJ/RimL family protein N-acetyltransferase